MGTGASSSLLSPEFIICCNTHCELKWQSFLRHSQGGIRTIQLFIHTVPYTINKSECMMLDNKESYGASLQRLAMGSALCEGLSHANHKQDCTYDINWWYLVFILYLCCSQNFSFGNLQLETVGSLFCLLTRTGGRVWVQHLSKCNTWLKILCWI